MHETKKCFQHKAVLLCYNLKKQYTKEEKQDNSPFITKPGALSQGSGGRGAWYARGELVPRGSSMSDSGARVLGMEASKSPSPPV